MVLIPLFTLGFGTDNFQLADGVQSKGSDAPGRTGAKAFGPATHLLICGDVLCKDYLGGRTAYERDQKYQLLHTDNSVQPENPFQIPMDQYFKKKSPYFQVGKGIEASAVMCNEGLDLLMKVSSEMPICVKPTSVERLVSLGFADHF